MPKSPVVGVRTAVATGVAALAAIAVAATLPIVNAGGGDSGQSAPTIQPTTPASTSTIDTDSDAPPTVAVSPADDPSTNTSNLLYLIEEEKLAHDVYVVLGELWGSRVFANIQNSETTHQGQVAELLVDAGVVDPRVAAIGEFTDPGLQALYDSLVERGSASEQEAFAVGVLIEETDIADLKTFLANEADPSVVAMLESLLAGSENHLAAFSRQLTT